MKNETIQKKTGSIYNKIVKNVTRKVIDTLVNANVKIEYLHNAKDEDCEICFVHNDKFAIYVFHNADANIFVQVMDDENKFSKFISEDKDENFESEEQMAAELVGYVNQILDIVK